MAPSISKVADSACCERDEGMNKVHSLLNNSQTSMTNHKNRSVRILLQGSEPQEDTSLNFERYWNAKHPGGIASRSRPLPRGQKYRNQKSSAKFQDWIEYSVRRPKSCITPGGLACTAVQTAPMWSITLIARSTDRSCSDYLRDRIVVGALPGPASLDPVALTRISPAWPVMGSSGETANSCTELEIH